MESAAWDGFGAGVGLPLRALSGTSESRAIRIRRQNPGDAHRGASPGFVPGQPLSTATSTGFSVLRSWMGTVTSRIPSVYLAVIFSVSAPAGRDTVRLNEP